MPMVKHRDDMRQRADWMAPADDDILELIREYGNLTPGAIEEFGGPSGDHAGHRARKLAAAGLLDQLTRGLYAITDDGHAYLNEEFDASGLPDPDE
jgi:hypothetical protein